MKPPKARIMNPKREAKNMTVGMLLATILLVLTFSGVLSGAWERLGIRPRSAEEAEAGFVTVVNGEAADYNKDGSWWCLTDAAGEMTSVGVADIELHDGDSYAFTYTK